MADRALKDSGKRIRWVDILRFLGMTLIYWGHLGTSEGVTLYIFAHHVPLFFFISGFFASLSPAEGSFFRFLWKKVRSLILPYLFFSALFYALQLAVGQLRFSQLPSALLVSAAGVRNQVPGPLWFFTCLFIVAIVFELIKRIMSAVFGNAKMGGFFSVLAALLLFLVGICFLGHEPTQDPLWFWNADSAFIYILYYALGALLFPLMKEWNFKGKTFSGKVFFLVFFVLSAAFAVFFLVKGADLSAWVSSFFMPFGTRWFPGEAFFELYALFVAMILIYFELSLARLLDLVPGISRFLAYVGKDSLYHCGNELIVKYFGRLAISALGLTGFFSNDFSLLFYSILCLIVLTFTLNLIERLLLAPVFGTGRIHFPHH